MNKHSPAASSVFRRSVALFDNLDGTTIAALLASCPEIALVIDRQGKITDVSVHDEALGVYGFEEMVGKSFADTVTSECVEKIEALLNDSETSNVTITRQVNHPADGHPDLPVAYKIISVSDNDARIAIGTDLRELARMQQQLIQVQFDLESEYRRIQEAETRYRSAFQKSPLAMLMVDGNRRTVLDANQAAANLLGKPIQKLSGVNVTTLFDKSCREPLLEALIETKHAGSGVAIDIPKPNSSGHITCLLEPYREQGNVNLITVLSHGDSGSVSAVPDLAVDGPMIRGIPEPYAITDDRGMVHGFNAQFLDLLGAVNNNQVIERNLNNWLGTSPVDTQALIARANEDGIVRGFSSFVMDELNNRKPVTVSARKFERSGDPWFGILLAHHAATETEHVPATPAIPGHGSDFSDLVGRVPMKELIRESLDVIEKMCIEAALEKTGNNRAAAAELLGLSRQSLYIKLKRHGIEDFDPRNSNN